MVGVWLIAPDILMCIAASDRGVFASIASISTAPGWPAHECLGRRSRSKITLCCNLCVPFEGTL
jgi:hypothetical protein